jgi:hypothetical protein
MKIYTKKENITQNFQCQNIYEITVPTYYIERKNSVKLASTKIINI